MNLGNIASWIKKITSFGRIFSGSPNAENTDPLDVEDSVSNKRHHDENFQEVVVPKKRKLDVVNGFGGTFSTFDSIKNMSNQRLLRSSRTNNRKTLGITDFSNASNQRVKNFNFNNCDNSTVNNHIEPADYTVGRSGENLSKKMNFLSRQGALQTNRSYLTRTGHRSLLCKDRITQEHDKEVFAEMVKKQAGPAVRQRKSLPLTTSTVHNTKQNNQVSLENSLIKGYYLRRFPALPIPSSLVPAKDTVSEKTVIDLTSDDNDDKERKMIETNVRNSSRLKNFKTSFVAKDTPMLNPEFIENLVKKYDMRSRTINLRVQNEKKKLQKKQEITDKSLVEILEKRLVLKEHVVEEKPTKDLAPLTEKMMEEIRKILSTRKIPLVQIKDTGIKIQDICTLQDCGWLNDEVINAYMNLIKIRSEEDPENYPKVHCFNTFFYPQLLSRGYNSVRRWTKKIDVFDHTLIIIPIHLGNHWCLTEIQTKEKVIRYYDSFGSPNNRCLEAMLKYLTDELQDKKGKKLNVSEWKVVNVPRDEIPNQKNAYDCGVFACTYAEHITRNASFNFLQEDMSYFREKMTYEILTGHLLL